MNEIQSEFQLNLNEVYPKQAIYGFQLAPDGQSLAFVLQRDKRVEEINIEGRNKLRILPMSDLYVLPSSGGYPRQLTDTGDFRNPGVWSPEGELLAVERQDGLQILPANGGTARAIYKGSLYHPPLNPADACLGYPRWSPDGQHILFATREDQRTELCTISRDGCLQRKLFSIEGYIISWDWSPTGKQVLLVSRSENGWVGDVHVLDIETGQSTIVSNENDYEYQKPIAAWSPNGAHIVFRSNRSNWAKLWITTPDGNPHRSLTVGDWDDYGFRFSPDGNSLVYASRAEQAGSGDDLWIIPVTGETPKRLTHHLGVNQPLAWAPDNKIYYWHSSPTEPGDVWAISSDGGEPYRLTFSAPLELERKLCAPEEIIITGEDNTLIPALLYLPIFHKEGDRYPAIVWIHGGPTGFSRYDFSPYLGWLANQGYIVAVPNFRGSTGYGVKHMEAVAGDGLGKNDLNDVLAAGRYVKALPNVELDRGVGVGGRSWGGYLTLMAVTQAPDLFSCAVAGAAIADWRIQQSQTEVRYYDRWLVGGWIYEQPQRVEERSPVNYVDNIKVPVLIFHGEEDNDVPFAQIKKFVDKARQADKEIEYLSYPVEGHSNKKPENQQDELNRTSAFFRRHLQLWNLRDNPCADQVQY